MAKRIILAIFLFLIISRVSICAAESSTESASQETDTSLQQFQGFNLVGYGEGGTKTWDIKGDKADIIGDVIKLTNIDANAYRQDPMNLKAKEGNLNKVSGNMHLEKDVVMTTQSGARLVTDSLDWLRDKDLVTTDDKVFLTKETMTAVGTGAIAHPGLNTAQLNEDVTVNVVTEPKGEDAGQKVTITCDGPLEVEYQKQTAIFRNNVVAVQEGGRELQADKMELFFDTETKQIKEMICTGNVFIKHGQNVSFAEKAVYKAEDQVITLLGRPKLILYTEGKDGSLFGSMLGKAAGEVGRDQAAEAGRITDKEIIGQSAQPRLPMTFTVAGWRAWEERPVFWQAGATKDLFKIPRSFRPQDDAHGKNSPTRQIIEPSGSFFVTPHDPSGTTAKNTPTGQIIDGLNKKIKEEIK